MHFQLQRKSPLLNTVSNTYCGIPKYEGHLFLRVKEKNIKVIYFRALQLLYHGTFKIMSGYATTVLIFWFSMSHFYKKKQHFFICSRSIRKNYFDTLHVDKHSDYAVKQTKDLLFLRIQNHKIFFLTLNNQISNQTKDSDENKTPVITAKKTKISSKSFNIVTVWSTNKK